MYVPSWNLSPPESCCTPLTTAPPLVDAFSSDPRTALEPVPPDFPLSLVLSRTPPRTPCTPDDVPTPITSPSPLLFPLSKSRISTAASPKSSRAITYSLKLTPFFAASTLISCANFSGKSLMFKSTLFRLHHVLNTLVRFVKFNPVALTANFCSLHNRSHLFYR